jgi:membrane protease YdiL (CAAX protease family)
MKFFPAGEAPRAESPLRPRRFPVGTALGLYSLLALAAVVWRALADGEPVWRAPGAGAAPGRLAVHVLAGVAVGLAVVAVSRAWTRRTRTGQALARALAEALGPLSARSVWALALASGVAEEAFFRGALQPRVGWLAASVLFGLAHLVPRRDLAPWALFAVAVGGLLGALFDATGDLAAPAVAHVLVNGLNLGWLARRTD